MLYETRVVDKEKNIVRVTTADERWYSKTTDGKTVWIPSTTWITGYYPKGIEWAKWLAKHGFDEAEALKEAAGDRGTMVHKAVEMLLVGKTIKLDTVVNDQRELTADEYAVVMSFVEWFEIAKPEIIFTEHTVFAPDDRYAGTLDIFCKIKGNPWLIDLKTSASIWPSMEIQISAYKHALGEDCRCGILQLGYKYNKIKKYKFTEVEDQWKLFNAVYDIWQKEVGHIQPLQKDYPLELSLKLNEEATDESTSQK